MRSRVPFMHFFEGFRTSHELNVLEMLSDDDKLKLSNLIGTRISDEAWKLMNKTKRQRKCKKRNKLFDNLEDDQKRWIASVKSVASQSV